MRFADLKSLCDHRFGQPRIDGSHHIYRTGLPDRPVNIQNDHGEAKPYQVRQVLAVLDAVAVADFKELEEP